MVLTESSLQEQKLLCAAAHGVCGVSPDAVLSALKNHSNLFYFSPRFFVINTPCGKPAASNSRLLHSIIDQ